MTHAVGLYLRSTVQPFIFTFKTAVTPLPPWTGPTGPLYLLMFCFHSCWITDITYLYATNVVYFSLVFIFNSGILLIVAVRVCCMVTTPARKGLGWRTATTVAGITCLLGVTWGLAFLGSGYVNLPILYLFCILNSTQGRYPTWMIYFSENALGLIDLVSEVFLYFVFNPCAWLCVCVCVCTLL